MTAEQQQQVALFGERMTRLRGAIGTVIVGQEQVVEEVLYCLFAGGHVLLEGAPGLGKTLLVRTLAEALSLGFSRIQFTPDLMPSDILGTQMVVGAGDDRRFELRRGPIFSQLVLADEINRATPKTQAALLEAMAESRVTIGGETHTLTQPFFVLATENPIEMEGTYPLPEAQLDRFLFKVMVPNPSEDGLVEILSRTTGSTHATPEAVMAAEDILAMRQLVREVRCAEPLARYAARVVRACDPDNNEQARRWVRHGPGVRGAQALLLGAKVAALAVGRTHVSFDDIRRVIPPALRHRLLPSFEAQADGYGPDAILEELALSVPTQAEGVA